MNIEFIKSEFEKLTLILRPWKEGQNISTIERDIVLDKLKNIYDAVRFADAAKTHAEAEAVIEQSGQETPAAAEEAPAQPAVAVAAAAIAVTEAAAAPKEEEAAPDTDNDEEGDEVEVEFIFNEEEEQAADDEAPETAVPTTEEAPAQETAATATVPPVYEAAATVQPEPVQPAATAAEPHVEAEIPVVTEAAAPAAAATQAEPQGAATTAADTAGISHEADKPAAAPHPVRNPMNSLFGNDEVKHRQPSRHHRMMSIYDYDTESKPEKVVNISKIFDNDDYAPDAKYDIDRYDTEEYTPAASHGSDTLGRTTADRAAEEGVTTLADAMSGSKHTLADTLTRPAPLAEQITHRATTSLRDAIGINDKFLLIRDLFAGDDAEYEKAIDELDSFDNLDDCMIYIVENYAWNPNSEGAKFIMQLLERKLS